ELMWQAQLYFGKSAHKIKEPLATYGQDLFKQPIKNYQLPTLEKRPFEDVFDELELLGFSLCDPFKLLATDNRGNTFSNQLIQKLNQRVEMVGYLVTTKNTATKDGKLMHFGTFYDCEGNVFDTTHFPPVARRYPFRGRGFYLLRGKVAEDFGYPMIEVDYMDKLPMVKSE
ncbi:MAG: DNA polymerase III subunit alpha, partial [Bacteroidetes bacterium]|nr:DNA polymerase III subunit alpha [Bacteroidota bacterium]